MAVCITVSCKYYNICARAACNVEGNHHAISYGTTGYGEYVRYFDGTISIVERMHCGERADYKMFKSIGSKDEDE